MKIKLVIFAFLLFGHLHAQEGWQLGFELNPSYFMMINETDNSAPPEDVIVTLPNVLGAPRGWSLGAKAFYGFNEYFGVQSGLRYSWSRQDYTFTYPNLDTLYVALPDGSITTELNYLQLPLSFQFQLINKNEDVFYISAGLAPSWLFRYYEQYVTYKHTGVFPPDGKIIVTTQTDINEEVSWIRTTDGNIEEEYNVDNDREWLYQKFMLFGVAEIGYKRYFTNGWGVNVGLNSYISLLNPENKLGLNRSTSISYEGKYKKLRSDLSGDTIDDRSKTTLLSVGITLGLVYNFDW